MKRLILFGHGKMGKLVEQLAPSKGFRVVACLENTSEIASAPEADVAIDFSVPSAVLPNVKAAAERRLNLVIGTTGWKGQLAEVQSAADTAGIGVVWGANFSIGVNLYLQIVARAAELFKRNADYEAWGHELHHSQKLDAPSGTMLKIMDEMRASGYEAKIDVSSTRAGKIPGTHEIGFDSSADTITLTHTARNREGFAYGALFAAEWISGKSGFFEFSDILFEKVNT